MTPEEFIKKYDFGFSLRAAEHDLDSVISAAVYAEHQRTLRQCAEESSHVILNYFDLADTRRIKLSEMVKSAIRALPYVTP